MISGSSIALKGLALAGLAAASAACQSVPQQPYPGLAFAQASCGGCHAVEGQRASPNPSAPPFAAIVNQQGLSDETLGTWLRDAHNYPEEMDFSLQGPEVDALVAYMLTLRHPDYRPGI